MTETGLSTEAAALRHDDEPWEVADGIVICQGGSETGPGPIMFVLRAPMGTSKPYPHEALSCYATRLVEAVNSHAALKSRVEELTKALRDIQAKTNGDRPTVHAGNAFHYWQQLNKTIIDIRERCGVALSLEDRK